MLESSRREQRAGREEKGYCRRGCQGDPPPPRPRHRPRQPWVGTHCPGHSARPLAAAPERAVTRPELGTSQQGTPPCPHLLPAAPGPRGSPAPVPACPGRSGPCGGARGARGSLRRPRQRSPDSAAASQLCRGRGRPETPARPLCPGPAHLRSRCRLPAHGPGPRRAPSLSQDPATEKCLRSPHLSSPRLTPPPGLPGPPRAAPQPPPPHRPSTPAPSAPPHRGCPPRADPGKRLPLLLPPTPAASQAAPAPGSCCHSARWSHIPQRLRAAARGSHKADGMRLQRHHKQRSFF